MAGSEIELRVAGILVRDGGVLLVRHEKPSASYWVIPGGRVEFGETLAEALEREFLEELAMEVEAGEILLVNDAAPSDGRRHVLNVYFSVSSNGEVSAGSLQGVAEARFFGENELAGLDLRPPLGEALAEVIRGGSSDRPSRGTQGPGGPCPRRPARCGPPRRRRPRPATTG